MNNENEDYKSNDFLFPSVISFEERAAQNVAEQGLNRHSKLSGFGSFKNTSKIITDDTVSFKKLDSHHRFPEGQFDDNHSEKTEEEYGYKKKAKRKVSSSGSDDDNRRLKKVKKKKKKKEKKRKVKDRGSRYDRTKPDKIWIEETSLKIEDAFRFDKRNCQDNLQFGFLYRLDIANYHRKNDIVCLGLGKHQHFEWTDKRSKKKKVKAFDLKSRYFNAVKPSRINDEGDTELKLSVYDNIGKEGSNLSTENSLAESRIDSNANHDVKTEKDLDKSEFTQKTEYFNERLRENPRDINLWLKFAKLQDTVFSDKDKMEVSSTFDIENEVAGQHKAVIEKKISILERALHSNPDSLPLIIEYMEYCRDILDPAEVNRKWIEFTFHKPNKGLLWEKYLMFVQSNLSNFSTSNVIAAYNKCFKRMLAISEGEIKTHNCDTDHLQNMFIIFIQYCQFLYQSDLPEKAIASFQALLEFNCFTPCDIKQIPASGQKAFFEAFWDSDTPRFGEGFAAGWESWMTRNKNSEENEPVPSNMIGDVSVTNCVEVAASKVLDNTLAKAENWLAIENERKTNQWLPVKQTEGGEDCDDPDRIVLADDIISCLFKLSSQVDVLDLILVHLSFLGVPLEQNLLSDCIFKKLLNLGFMPMELSLFSNMHETAFICLYAFEFFGAKEVKILKLTDYRICYIEEVFSQSLKVAERFSDNFTNIISRCWLYFKIMKIKNSSQENLEGTKCEGLNAAVKKTRKFAKSLLKHAANRNCLELWQIFAHFEYDFGNRQEAFRVFDMLILKCIADQPSNFARFSWMFRNYAGFLMQAVQNETANANQLENKILNLLLLLLSQDASSTTISTEKPNPLRTRRIKEAYRETFTRVLDEAHGSAHSEGPKLDDNKFEWVLCFALFSFFCENIHSADVVFGEFQENIQLNDSQALRLINLKLDMIKFKCTRQCANVAEFRNALWTAVAEFPNDFGLHKRLLEVESKSIASLKVRRHHHEILANAESLLPWLFAIAYEEERLKNLRSVRLADVNLVRIAKDTVITTLPNTGIVNRIRGLYNRATSSREGRCCVPLWRSYFRFEVKNGDPKRAKNIFYSALQNCPWSKAIYTDYIGVHGDELENIIDIMQEKEIRIRVPIEELEILLEEDKMDNQ